MLLYIPPHIPICHPLGHHAKFEQFGRDTFDRQDVWVLHFLGNYDFLAVFLGKGSQINPRSDFGWGHPYLVNPFDRIFFVHAKNFDSEHPIVIFLIGELPCVGESSGSERSSGRPA